LIESNAQLKDKVMEIIKGISKPIGLMPVHAFDEEI
jgi:hypothetical protein